MPIFCANGSDICKCSGSVFMKPRRILIATRFATERKILVSLFDNIADSRSVSPSDVACRSEAWYLSWFASFRITSNLKLKLKGVCSDSSPISGLSLHLACSSRTTDVVFPTHFHPPRSCRESRDCSIHQSSLKITKHEQDDAPWIQ